MLVQFCGLQETARDRVCLFPFEERNGAEQTVAAAMLVRPQKFKIPKVLRQWFQRSRSSLKNRHHNLNRQLHGDDQGSHSL